MRRPPHAAVRPREPRPRIEPPSSFRTGYSTKVTPDITAQMTARRSQGRSVPDGGGIADIPEPPLGRPNQTVARSRQSDCRAASGGQPALRTPILSGGSQRSSSRQITLVKPGLAPNGFGRRRVRPECREVRDHQRQKHPRRRRQDRDASNGIASQSRSDGWEGVTKDDGWTDVLRTTRSLASGSPIADVPSLRCGSPL